MSKRSANLRDKCNVNLYFKTEHLNYSLIIELIIFPGRPIQYRTIQQKPPNVITLHGEKVNTFFN